MQKVTMDRHVYGNDNDNVNDGSDSSFRKKSKRLSRTLIRRISSFAESPHETPERWSLLLCVAISAFLANEIYLQKQLTKSPITFGQLPAGSFIEKIYRKMTVDKDDGNKCTSNILSRSIRPSLFVGTRGMISSTMAYLKGGPFSTSKKGYTRFREYLDMSQDGARISVDWEFARSGEGEDDVLQSEIACSKQEILEGVIRNPVVIILHGINNDSSFGYMQSLSRAFCNRGYISASMNFRGCGGVKLNTPRGYNGAYTGDLRSLVRQISARVKEGTPIFLVGNSLGANIMTKYLGEEGITNTLPSCISGAAGLGNPLSIDSGTIKFPFNVLMALGVKKICFENLKSFYSMKDSNSKAMLRKALLSPTIANMDNSAAPGFIRNDTHYPYGTKIGYESGKEYWFEASSYRYIQHISIPFLNLIAQNDFLVHKPSRNKLGFCLSNPNVMHVETRCGGHLGWQETSPDRTFGVSSWADTAVSDFFHAIMSVNNETTGKPLRKTNPVAKSKFDYPEPFTFKKEMEKELMQVKVNSMTFTRSIDSKL
mmetsp:Transcript_41225/g.44761  ORF Transcript_41225/g.44761 Transcript_41225/m.44761 type:complete len:541 (-) Transcript_41225:23-1645(-)